MPLKNKKKSNWPKQSHRYVKYTGLAFQMGALMFACYWGGQKLDAWRGDGRLFTIALTLLGVFGSIYTLIRDLTKDIDDDG